MEDRNEEIEPFREEMLKMCRRGSKTEALKIIQSRMEEILNDGPITPQNRIQYNELYCLLFEIGDSIKNGNIRRNIHSTAMDYDVYNLRIAILIAHQSSTGPISKFLTNLRSSLDMVERVGMKSTLEQLNKEINDIKTGNGIEEEISEFKKIIDILSTNDQDTPVTKKKKKKSKKSRKRKRLPSDSQQNSKRLNCNNMETITCNRDEPSTSLTQISDAVFIDFSEPNIIPGLFGAEKKNGENLGTESKSKIRNSFNEARKNGVLDQIRSFDNRTVNNGFISNFRKPNKGSGLNRAKRKYEIFETNKSTPQIGNGLNEGDIIRKLDYIETYRNDETIYTGFISNFRDPNKGSGVNKPKRMNEILETNECTLQIENGPHKETLNNEAVNTEVVEARTTNEEVESNENISKETEKIKQLNDIGTMTNEIIDNDDNGNIGEESSDKERIIKEKEDFPNDAGKNQNLHNGNKETNEDTADFNEANKGQQLNDKDRTNEQVKSNGTSRIDNVSNDAEKNRRLNKIEIITDVTLVPDANIKIENKVLESSGVTESSYDSSDDCVEIIVQHEIIVID